ncbi:hypothetical protein HYH02_012211 [Chlamydomonas schloesseri]|uniref:Mitotic-spindle organizing protein 1 n=1 Tax=Chlamydomonas schloesseri TaxID=2026947 RepID=A0A835SWK8_9CHLO|nr:hypothetical protein HYH02_012211 [Chlamydomonas schloesseri]|eukprot:KAG2434544.1 hypothetical protein HYH02_012211 [Chlamydomonas schloesseri]
MDSRSNLKPQSGKPEPQPTVPARAFDAAFELSNLLETGLDKDSLAILLELLNAGVNPEALATVVRELRREAAEYQAAVERVNAASAVAAASGAAAVGQRAR